MRYIGVPQRSHVIMSWLGSAGGLRMAETTGVMIGFF
jgi:hypothetical protein